MKYFYGSWWELVVITENKHRKKKTWEEGEKRTGMEKMRDKA